MLDALTSIDLESNAPEPARFDRILVAVDEARGSQPALMHAIDLAIVAQAALVCAVVVCPEVLPGENEYGLATRVEEMRGQARRYLAEVTALAAARGAPAVEGLVLEGIAADAILEAAVLRKVTLIVIGTEQRRVLERLMFGCSADQILRRSRLPVTVVHS